MLWLKHKLILKRRIIRPNKIRIGIGINIFIAIGFHKSTRNLKFEKNLMIGPSLFMLRNRFLPTQFVSGFHSIQLRQDFQF